jgi:hypothetical protein
MVKKQFISKLDHLTRRTAGPDHKKRNCAD